MTGKSHENDPLSGVEMSRRELIQRIVVGSAFALPVIASFDMALLDPSAYANYYGNQLGYYGNQPDPPSFTSAAAATFTVGQDQTFGIVTPGFAEMVVSQSGTLPKGVVFTAIDNDGTANTTDGSLSGTPAANTGGVYPITLTASNTGNNGNYVGGTVTQAFTLTVHQPPAFSTATAATLNVNSGATINIKTTGYPAAAITLSGSLPSGMSFTANASAGTAIISGTPGSSGVYTVQLSASNGVGAAVNQTLILTVQEAPGFTSTAEATFSTRASSSFAITTDGLPEATITLSGALPAGLSFDADPAAGTATISGKPSAAAAGTHQLTLTAANGVSPNSTQALRLTVTPSNVFTTSNVKTTDTTEVGFSANVPGPGTITAHVTAPASAASAAKKTAKRLTLASTKVTVKKAGKLKLKTKPTAAGRRFAKAGNSKTQMWLVVTYTPRNGKPATHTVKKLHLK